MTPLQGDGLLFIGVITGSEALCRGLLKKYKGEVLCRKSLIFVKRQSEKCNVAAWKIGGVF